MPTRSTSGRAWLISTNARSQSRLDAQVSGVTAGHRPAGVGLGNNRRGPLDERLVAAEEKTAIASTGGCREQLRRQIGADQLSRTRTPCNRAAQRTPVPSPNT